MIDISVNVGQGDEIAEAAQLYTMVGYNGGVSSHDVTLIARTNGRLVGAVRLCDEGSVKVLRGMHVHPDFQQQGVGSALLSHCEPHLADSYAYCLPYAHLVRFYERIKFAVAEIDELPPFIADRLAVYVSAGQKVIAMKRSPCG